MYRADKSLAEFLQYENIAWYEDGKVKILDRRYYPMKKDFVICNTFKEVAEAITAMVTQSGGPYLAASMGMVLAAKESLSKNNREDFLKKAAHTIKNARPTTSTKMEKIVNGALEVAINNLDKDNSLVEKMFAYAIEEVNSRYEHINKIGRYFADTVKDGYVIMTQCFPDAVLGMVLKELIATNKTNIKFYVPETRPYLQGSRLTASVIKSMGYEATVITDNMCAFTMQQKNVDVCFSAADVITMDGYVVNKIGTFQIALAAHNIGIPYYCLGTPNKKHKLIDSVKIEERDGEEVLQSNGVKNTLDGVKGYYPAFDITPPQYCSGIVTEKGTFPPFSLINYENIK